MTGSSAHDHWNCAMCDQVEAERDALQARVATLEGTAAEVCRQIRETHNLGHSDEHGEFIDRCRVPLCEAATDLDTALAPPREGGRT